MLSGFARSLINVSSCASKHRQLPINCYRVSRLLSQSAIRCAANQVEDNKELIFDLGGGISSTSTNKRRTEKRSGTKKSSAKIIASETKTKIPKDKKKRTFDELKTHDLSLDLTYVKLPFHHPQLEKLMLMIKGRKYREQHNLLLIEGRRLTLEAVQAGLKIKYLLFSNLEHIEEVRGDIRKALTKNTEIIRVPHNDLSFWSTLTTCPGLIVVFEKPANMAKIWERAAASAAVAAKDSISSDQTEDVERPNQMFNEPIPITVICDQVREPNNLGSIIRTCAAVPCTKIILLKGCADPWDIKALRGGCGAQFRIPIIAPTIWEDLSQHLPSPNDTSVFIADNQTSDNTMEIARNQYEKDRKENNAQYFPSKIYSDISFHSCKHITLIIGGETEGVSSHAFDFMDYMSKEATEQNTDKEAIDTIPDNCVVEIPLGGGIESLNAGVATAILLFEMRKQLIQ